MSKRPIALLVLSLSALLTLAAPSGSAAERPASIDPEKLKADPDFAIQGEYSGEVGTPDGRQKYGVQVIARGDGKFRAVAYPGGLPGDGWEPSAGKLEADGRTIDGVITFKAEGMSAVGQVKDGAIVISDPEDGDVAGRLEKVHRKSPTLGARPPEGARVLFDGKDVNDFTKKATEDGLLPQGSNSKSKHGSCTLHIEFLLPFEPKGSGQGRGNSGVYLQGRYEVQVLDSFGLEGRDNECGGIYTVAAPAVNMCLPPMQWQTYDIEFTAAKYEGRRKVANARMTVRHNGVVIHQDVEVPRATTAAPNREGPEDGILHLQDHGHPVRFRNIWLVETK